MLLGLATGKESSVSISGCCLQPHAGSATFLSLKREGRETNLFSRVGYSQKTQWEVTVFCLIPPLAYPQSSSSPRAKRIQILKWIWKYPSDKNLWLASKFLKHSVLSTRLLTAGLSLVYHSRLAQTLREDRHRRWVEAPITSSEEKSQAADSNKKGRHSHPSQWEFESQQDQGGQTTQTTCPSVGPVNQPCCPWCWEPVATKCLNLWHIEPFVVLSSSLNKNTIKVVGWANRLIDGLMGFGYALVYIAGISNMWNSL